MEKQDEPWTFYVIEGKDKAWYAGVTLDFDRRLRQHNAGTGAKYTRGRGPFVPILRLGLLEKSAAHVLEAKFKKLSRTDKELFVLGGNSVSDRLLPKTTFGISVWRQR